MIFPVGFHQKADILSQSSMRRAFAGKHFARRHEEVKTGRRFMAGVM
jgi:hypothetical protein